MTPSVPDEMRHTHEELLTQFGDLVASAFLDSELDRDALLGTLGLDDSSKSAFFFSRPDNEPARQDVSVPTKATPRLAVSRLAATNMPLGRP